MKKSFKLATIGFVVVSMLGLVAAAAGRDKI